MKCPKRLPLDVRRPLLPLTCLLAIIVLGSTSPLRAQRKSAASAMVPGEILVRFASGPLAARAQTAHRKTGARVLRRFRSGWQQVKLPGGWSVASGLQRYRALKSEGVVAVQPNYIYRAFTTPNDTRYANLYGMAKISAPAAWDTQTGSSNVVVAVVDTGVAYNHPDLSNNMWRNPGESGGGKETNGLDDDANGFVDDVFGIDTANNDANPYDDNSHGTHVAGTIGAAGNNGLGVTGVNWNVKIMALKFMAANGSGTTAGALQCFDYISLMKSRGVNIRVVNNSWGTGGYDTALASGILSTINTGILNVCAAGNDGVDTDVTASFPSNINSPGMISVAASDGSDNPAWFTNFGANSVDLAAPGVGIESTAPGNSYGYKSGTSMATPHVAGAAALLFAARPSLNIAALRQHLLSRVDVLPQWSGKVVTGGRLNVGRALQSALGILTTPTIAAFSPEVGAVGANVTITGTGFTGTQSVAFNGTAANFTYISPTELRASVPAHATTGTVQVTTVGGSALSGNVFTVAPRIVSLSPTSGPAGAAVTIAGANFTGATSVKIGSLPTPFVVNSATQISATLPSNAVSGKISVATPAGSALSALFTVTTPAVTGFAPKAAPEGAAVTVNGANFTNATAVQFDGTSASFTVLSATQISAIVPAGAITGPLTVANSAGTATSATLLKVLPRVLGFTPASGAPGTTVVITGSTFGDATAVRFDKLTAAFTINSPTQITAMVPVGALTGKITVTNTAGLASSLNNFVVAPRIAGFSPASAAAGATITLSGANFTNASAVRFNGVTATFNSVAPARLTAVVPPGATSGPLTVVTPAGTAPSAATFKVLPKITSFSPASGAPGDSVTITGTTLGGVTSVKFGSLPASFSVNSPTKIIATVPANATTNKISVKAPEGIATSANDFVVAPRITGFSPTSGPWGTMVTLYGANFTNATRVAFNGTAASFTFVSPTRLTATVPVAATTGKISVATPVGTAQSAINFTVTSPTIIGLSPVSGAPGGSVVITGANFAASSAVVFNGVSATFVVNSPTQITATVPPAATTGPISITTPNGTASGPVFTVTPS